MKVAIMQPYFFPYLGYFQLIKHTDIFILFDDVQYIRHGWVNRNRILKPEQDWQYILAPLQEHEQTTLIKEIKVQDKDIWKDKILRQIEHYKRKSPFYPSTKILLEECFNHVETNITKLNGFYLEKVCNYIGLPLNLKISSSQNFNYSNIQSSGDWALNICQQIGGSLYLNPINGKELFNSLDFSNANIELSFLSCTDITYSQRRNGIIESGLSIIDVLMFNSIEQIHNLLEKCEIVKAQ